MGTEGEGRTEPKGGLVIRIQTRLTEKINPLAARRTGSSCQKRDCTLTNTAPSRPGPSNSVTKSIERDLRE